MYEVVRHESLQIFMSFIDKRYCLVRGNCNVRRSYSDRLLIWKYTNMQLQLNNQNAVPLRNERYV